MQMTSVMAQAEAEADDGTVQHLVDPRIPATRAVSGMPLVRVLWTAAGSLFLAVGVAGILLPLLPGTVFLLAASACYVRGSERLDRWLTSHPVLGHHLRVITGQEAMPLRSKIVAISAMWIAVTVSIAGSDIVPMQAGLSLLAAAGTWFIAVRR